MALKGTEVAKHNSAESCWVIVHGKAFDVTEFLPEHPGGSKIILKYAGKDATEAFDPIHPSDTMDKYLPTSKHKGAVDMSTVAAEEKVAVSAEEEARLVRVKNKPTLSECFNLTDFESVARGVMKKTAWGYYSSAAEDEITLRENHAAYHRIWFRPRVLVDVTSVSFSTTMLGTPTSVPFYITATALGKLGHPEGEVVLTRAAASEDLIQMIPTLASCSFDEIVDAGRTRSSGGSGTGSSHVTQWFQLYVNKDREVTRRLVQHAEARGCTALFLTVDAPQLGRREKDMRCKFDEEASDVQKEDEAKGKEKGKPVIDRSQGAARTISSFIDPALSWKDLAWFRSITSLPIILKGVQCLSDVLRAAEDPSVDGIVLSNHGGRQLEFSPSGIELLAEVMPVLRAKGLDTKLDIFVDGGVRRGTDILKAICLGAKGVGIGRPLLYAMSAYGQEGVEKAVQLLKDELHMGMRLLGATKIEDLGPHLLDTKSLGHHGNGIPRDTLTSDVYDALAVAGWKSKL